MATTVYNFTELNRALEGWETIRVVGLDLGYQKLVAPEFELDSCYSRGPVNIEAGIVQLVDCQLQTLTTDAAIVKVFDSHTGTIEATRAERLLIVNSHVEALHLNDNVEIALIDSRIGRITGAPRIRGMKRSYVEVDLDEQVELELI
jgi:hypothetical protein